MVIFSSITKSDLFFYAALAKAQQLLLDPQEREYLLNQINAARGLYKPLHFIFLFNIYYSSNFNLFMLYHNN